jgi:hypothetical protein
LKHQLLLKADELTAIAALARLDGNDLPDRRMLGKEAANTKMTTDSLPT